MHIRCNHAINSCQIHTRSFFFTRQSLFCQRLFASRVPTSRSLRDDRRRHRQHQNQITPGPGITSQRRLSWDQNHCWSFCKNSSFVFFRSVSQRLTDLSVGSAPPEWWCPCTRYWETTHSPLWMTWRSLSPVRHPQTRSQTRRWVVNVYCTFCFAGNLCRCTGYRPIVDGYRTFCGVNGAALIHYRFDSFSWLNHVPPAWQGCLDPVCLAIHFSNHL